MTRVICVRALSEQSGGGISLVDVMHEGKNAAAGTVRDLIDRLVTDEVRSISVEMDDSEALGSSSPRRDRRDRELRVVMAARAFIAQHPTDVAIPTEELASLRSAVEALGEVAR